MNIEDRVEMYLKYAAALQICIKHNLPESMALKYDNSYHAVPCFNDYKENYAFIQGVVEGRPVFVGDRLFSRCGDEVIIDEELFDLVKYIELVESLSWSDSSKIFLLNDVRLPAPVKASDATYPMYVAGVQYDFKCKADARLVEAALNDILNKALMEQ